jgi:hypothetical protein
VPIAGCLRHGLAAAEHDVTEAGESVRRDQSGVGVKRLRQGIAERAMSGNRMDGILKGGDGRRALTRMPGMEAVCQHPLLLNLLAMATRYEDCASIADDRGNALRLSRLSQANFRRRARRFQFNSVHKLDSDKMYW